MARLLEQQPVAPAPLDAEESAGTGRSTARALATAIALLMVSLLVVTRSRASFDANPADAAASFASGDVRLSDDDRGRTLFDIPNMVPGRPATDCITVTYEGNVVPVDVGLEADAEGALAPALLIQIEGGTGGGFQDCAGFEPDETVFDGTLSDLAASDEALPVLRAEETPQSRTFRFTFSLDDAVPVAGRAAASSDFLWVAES